MHLSCSVDLYDRCLLLAALRRDDLNDWSGGFQVISSVSVRRNRQPAPGCPASLSREVTASGWSGLGRRGSPPHQRRFRRSRTEGVEPESREWERTALAEWVVIAVPPLPFVSAKDSSLLPGHALRTGPGPKGVGWREGLATPRECGSAQPMMKGPTKLTANRVSTGLPAVLKQSTRLPAAGSRNSPCSEWGHLPPL